MADRASATSTRLPPAAAEQWTELNAEAHAGGGRRGAGRARAAEAEEGGSPWGASEGDEAAVYRAEAAAAQYREGAFPGEPGQAYDPLRVVQAIHAGNRANEARFRRGMDMLSRIRDGVGALSEPNVLSEYLAHILQRSIEPILQACYNVYKNSPEILLASGIALSVNYFGPSRYPVLAASSDRTLAGSVDLAKLVGTTFFFKSALEPFRARVVHFKRDDSLQRTKTFWHQRVLHYFNPLALALIAAYARGWNVKPLEGTLYSVGLFACMELLGKGFDYACNWKEGSPAVPEESIYVETPDAEPAAEDF